MSAPRGISMADLSADEAYWLGLYTGLLAQRSPDDGTFDFIAATQRARVEAAESPDGLAAWCQRQIWAMRRAV